MSRVTCSVPFALALALGVMAEATARPSDPTADFHEPGTLHQQLLDANDLAVWISNSGVYALNLHTYDAGLEYPRGSGKPLAYAAGLWVAGRAPEGHRTAIAEFGTEYVPGPVVGDSFATDTARFIVYKASNIDTTGWAEWLAYGADLGAPLDASATRPGIIGDQTIWTVFNDMSTAPQNGLRYGRRLTTPIGLEVQLTAHAYDRSGPLRNIVFLHYRIVHRGTTALDSVYVGLFLDPHASHSTPVIAACDTALDLGYAFRRLDQDEIYGFGGPAVGLRLLRGPRASNGDLLRMTSFVAYPNGSDPADSAQFHRSLHGFLPWGPAIVDSSTGMESLYWSSGDPVNGTGWVSTNPAHPHTILGSGPFHFAPADTQELDVALIAGQGANRLASVSQLRLNAIEAKRVFDDHYTSVPPPALRAVRAWPNPSAAGVRIGWSVASNDEPVQVTVHDVGGRRLRTVLSQRQLVGNHEIRWDGMDDQGQLVRPGLYFVRVAVGGRSRTVRLALVR